MKCRKCGSIKIKSKRNYTHGSKSKARYSRFCKDCGSYNIETENKFRRRR